MLTDGTAEQEFRARLREVQAAHRKLTDALWGRAFAEEMSWGDARTRLEKAAAAFEREIGTAPEALALDAVGPEAA
jgi:hypothetical protein